MKTLIILTFVMLCASCSKNCNDVKDLRCDESPATGVTCQAYFESWIYDDATGKCQFQGYSGCSMVGFETEEECEQCECNN